MVIECKCRLPEIHYFLLVLTIQAEFASVDTPDCPTKTQVTPQLRIQRTKLMPSKTKPGVPPLDSEITGRAGNHLAAPQSLLGNWFMPQLP